jgi:hypothetical protein
MAVSTANMTGIRLNDCYGISFMKQPLSQVKSNAAESGDQNIFLAIFFPKHGIPRKK